METTQSVRTMSRRDLLTHSIAVGASFAIGAGFVTAPNAAWAVETKHLVPATFATLLQMARDIYPHDKIGDELYVKAIKGYDTAGKAKAVESGIAALNKAAGGDYLATKSESDRVAVLKTIQDSSFFQTIRGGLVTGLYNQKAVWPVFGFEGESFSKGGYINRGFDDINWL